MTKTKTFKCEITITQTKDLECADKEENTVMVELTCDDPATQQVIDTNAKVAVASTGQLLSLAVASIIIEASVAFGKKQQLSLLDFFKEVVDHLNSGGERMDPEIMKFDINI